VYPPEPVVSSRTSADVAASLQEHGDRVTVICPFPSRPGSRIHDGFVRRWRERTTGEGTETIRTWSIISKKSTLLSRLTENLSFGISSAAALLRARKLDALYLNSWPVFATGLVVLIATLKRMPYVLSVQDVYPESLLVQNRLGGRIAAPFLRWIDQRIAKRAAAVIVLSEAFASIYRDDRGVAPERIHIIPNWTSDTGQESHDGATSYRRSRGIADDDFLVVYGGNVGVAAGVEQLVHAFELIGDRKIHLLIAGGGARAEACETLARQIAPGRVHFHRPWNDDETHRVLASADLLALPTAGAQSRFSVPSKLISYLFAERPVIAAVENDSEIARIIRTAGAGWLVEPENPQQWATAIVAAAQTPKTRRQEMGESGRRYAQDHFTREQAVNRILHILRSIAA
jgi:glycosyltransferase involved in cell wall biosynthesis